MKKWEKRFLYGCSAALCLSALAVQPTCSALADSNPVGYLSGTASGNTSGETNVTVEFTQANVYIVRMPNFDFGNNHSLIDDKEVSLYSGSAAQRSLVVSSDANVDFSVEVSAPSGVPYMWDTDNKKPIGYDYSGKFASLSFAPNASGQITNIADIDDNSKWVLADVKGTGSDSHKNPRAIPAIDLGDFSSSKDSHTDSDRILFVKGSTSNSGSDGGRFGVSFVDSSSAKMSLNDKAMQHFRTEVLGTHKHVNIVFPLQWTATINPSDIQP
ncbi:hypothetical protein DS832_00295 [Bombilactobacillus bombi]|uniref:WxL domain-containing protein n=1 Tax=Bombilactobacillus bombi TaxID=1303590 RepID=A0A417ZD48_9LACO|nr:hypothetical protein [Bombilactobacillus bombi]RHW48723.1 hypothetical protein DS832_00295 [Bombilactobacillus bombi]